MAAPSRTADGQARKRALSRYPEEPDAGGFFVRGRREPDRSWQSVPCECGDCLQRPEKASKFASREEGVQHEATALHARRAAWRNLAPKPLAEGDTRSSAQRSELLKTLFQLH